MELEPNSLDWNGNELEHELEIKLEDMKRTIEDHGLIVAPEILAHFHKIKCSKSF